MISLNEKFRILLSFRCWRPVTSEQEWDPVVFQDSFIVVAVGARERGPPHFSLLVHGLQPDPVLLVQLGFFSLDELTLLVDFTEVLALLGVDNSVSFAQVKL